MFENLDSIDQFLIYGALLNSIRTNCGHGFINSDQGHLAYRCGANGDILSHGTIGDHPERNRLYKMMRELSDALKDHPELRRSDLVFSWQDFCKIAIDAYENPVTRR